MAVREVQKSYTFPRIPLNFNLPDHYPILGAISNISVMPSITNFRYTREELEIEGEYELIVSYHSAPGNGGSGPEELQELEYDDFFSHLKLEADGLFAEQSGDEADRDKNKSELYTVHFSRPFHTYVDLGFIPRPRAFRPGMVVERILLDAQGDRTLKGELVLGLINRPRRGSW